MESTLRYQKVRHDIHKYIITSKIVITSKSISESMWIHHVVKIALHCVKSMSERDNVKKNYDNYEVKMYVMTSKSTSWRQKVFQNVNVNKYRNYVMILRSILWRHNIKKYVITSKTRIGVFAWYEGKYWVYPEGFTGWPFWCPQDKSAVS